MPAVYIDYGKLITLASSAETKYEAGVELLFMEKFPLIVEVGSGTLTPKQAYSNGTYESTGIYYRVGAGYVSSFTPKNKLGITFRYGISSFEETGRIVIESPSETQPTVVQEIQRSNLRADWFEAVIYSDRKLNELLTIGVNIRLRVLNEYDAFEPVDIYAIPGYGRSFDKSIPAINLFIKAGF